MQAPLHFLPQPSRLHKGGLDYQVAEKLRLENRRHSSPCSAILMRAKPPLRGTGGFGDQ